MLVKMVLESLSEVAMLQQQTEAGPQSDSSQAVSDAQSVSTTTTQKRRRRRAAGAIIKQFNGK